MKRPVRIAATLEDLLTALGLPSVGFQARLAKSWPSVVGPLLADKTAPAGLRHGVLSVRVPCHALAQELQFMKPDLLKAIGAAPGGDAVREIRFVVGDLSVKGDEAPPPGKTMAAPPPPLPDPDGLDGVRDPETRDILRSLSRKAGSRKA